MILDINFVLSVLNVRLDLANQEINSVKIDSRQLAAGDVFVAIKGENFDGHDFIDSALEQGAVLIISSDKKWLNHPRCVVVEDTVLALGELARAWRLALNPYVIGITGSGGKTTVKEMLALVLKRIVGEDKVLATQGNFNNHLGLPLTLLKLKAEQRFAIIEMGMNHFGELDYLTQIAKPDVALVNNILRAHVGCGFDSVADIARAKREIFHGLSKDGLAILPVEDEQYAVLVEEVEEVEEAEKLASSRQLSFGIEQGDIHAADIKLSPLSSRFSVLTPQGDAIVNLPVPGLHNIHNALASIACCADLAFDLADIVAALAEFHNVKGRLNIHQLAQGQMIIDDTYNANPDSMKAAIDVLVQLPAPQLFIMGDMGELGQNSAQLHQEIGTYAKEKAVKYAFFVGKDSQHAYRAFGSAGLIFTDKKQLSNYITTNKLDFQSALVKGSRFMQMEEIVQQLIQNKN